MTERWQAAGLSLLLVVALSCGPKKEEAAPVPPEAAGRITNVSVETVAARAMVETILLPGTIIPDAEMLLSVEVGGVAERIIPRKGDRVRGGEVLAEINRQQLKASLELAEAGLSQARLAREEAALSVHLAANQVDNAERAVSQAKLAVRQAETFAVKAAQVLANQRASFERIRKLFEERLAPKATFDDAQTAYQNASSDLEAAKSAVASASESVRMAEGNLSSAELAAQSSSLRVSTAEAQVVAAETAVGQARLWHDKGLVVAPFDAWVDEVFFEQGEFVKVESALFRLIKIDPVKVSLSLPERDIPFVRKGDRAVVTVGSLPGRTFEGGVWFVGLSSDPATNTYPVEVTLANPGGTLRSGMVAQVSLVRRKVDAAVAVPTFAVIAKEQGEVVFVLADGKAARRSVKTGIRENGWVQVAEGLAPGERLIVKGHRDLEDGQEVKVLP